MQRRNFLSSTFCLFGLNQFSFAQNNPVETLNNNKLIIILLRGAADGLSILPPYSEPNYYKYRPNISVNKNNLIKINSKYGIHLSLKDSLLNFYENNQIILIPNSGQLDNSRSHFQAQEVMEFGVNNITNDTGFLYRMSQITKNSKPFSFTIGIPESFKGYEPIKSSNLNNYYSNIQNSEVNLINEQYKNDKKLLRNFSDVLEYKNTMNYILINNPNYNNKTLGGKIGTFIRTEKINLSFIDFDGWDTHSNQGTNRGTFNDLLIDLNSNLKDLKENLQEEWDNTLIAVMSEFGRTIKENGSLGSDHGHGNLMFITGGLVKENQILDDNFTLDINLAHEFRDINAQYDYREILGNILKYKFKYSDESINYIFPKLLINKQIIK